MLASLTLSVGDLPVYIGRFSFFLGGGRAPCFEPLNTHMDIVTDNKINVRTCDVTNSCLRGTDDVGCHCGAIATVVD